MIDYQHLAIIGAIWFGVRVQVNPEKLKMRQMAKAKRWESEMNAKVSALLSVVIGCLWWNPLEAEPRTPEYDELKKYTVGGVAPFRKRLSMVLHRLPVIWCLSTKHCLGQRMIPVVEFITIYYCILTLDYMPFVFDISKNIKKIIYIQQKCKFKQVNIHVKHEEDLLFVYMTLGAC